MFEALSRRYTLLSILKAKILGSYTIEEFNKGDEDSKVIIGNFMDHDSYILQDGFLFKNNKICVYRGSLWELLVREAHNGAFGGHLALIKQSRSKEHFCWPRMTSDVYNVVSMCDRCHKAKRTFHQWLYTPLPTLNDL